MLFSTEAKGPILCCFWLKLKETVSFSVVSDGLLKNLKNHLSDFLQMFKRVSKALSDFFFTEVKGPILYYFWQKFKEFQGLFLYCFWQNCKQF